MRRLFLEDLPVYSSGANKGKTNWIDSVGLRCRFQYDDISGEFDIVNKDKKYIYFTYNDKEYRKGIGHFKNCEIADVLGKFKLQHIYNIGDIVNELEIIEHTNELRKSGAYHRTYTVRCVKDGYINYHVSEYHLKGGRGCPVCSSRFTAKGINDIATTHPHLIKYFVNIEDAYKYSYSSNKRLDMVCPECGFTHKCTPNYLSNSGFPCKKCGDGYSYPSKFVFNMLDQLDVKFIPEYSPEWAEGRKYDFYIPSEKLIIEVDGEFHRNDNNMSGQTARESFAIDLKKDIYALRNGIDIRRIEYSGEVYKTFIEKILKCNLHEKLKGISSIDWEVCHRFACNSRVKEACDLWNGGIRSTKEIGDIMKIYNTTVVTYLKKGKLLNMCDYDKEESLRNGRILAGKKRAKPIIMMKDGIVIGEYQSATWLEDNSCEILGEKLLQTSISGVCNKNGKTYKGYEFKYKEVAYAN